ncbi:MAG TPA: dihydroorotase [Sphingomicrobium sp.]|nr:dihydroorotase [Sphingomicrobium sp.]
MAIQTLTIRKPDDWHVHLRDGAMLDRVAPYTARQFARAIVMPNTVPPITTVEAAVGYRDRIVAATGGGGFTPLMTCYLTDDTSPDEVARGFEDRVWLAAKLYPAGATTNSASGVTDIRRIHPVLERMERIGMILCVHGEVTDPQVDVFDREAVFIERVLEPVTRDFPELKIVLEHITTGDAVDFVHGRAKVGATVTPQHLIINRNALFAGGLRPHFYCLPVAKREKHRLAVREAATSGWPNVFLGTDSAPHAREAKESACGCAGIFNAPFALECYAAVFEEEGALDRFEAFTSENGARFYGLPLNEGTITLERAEVAVPEEIAGMVPFQAGETLRWKLAD